MTTKVYKYGLLRPIENETGARQELRGAHMYRNDLIAIERGRRAALRELTRESDAEMASRQDELRAADAALDGHIKAISEHRSQTRARAIPEELRIAAQQARATRKELARSFAEYRKSVVNDETYLAVRDTIRSRANELVRGARALRQCEWGTGGLVEIASQQSFGSMPLYDGAEPNDPRFVRWDGTGNLGVQLMGGAEAAEIFSPNHTQLQVGAVDERAWHSESRGERRRLSRTTLRMRVGSSERREPVWATWPMIMHRPLPEKGRIKSVQIGLRRVGPTEEWFVCFSVDCSETPVRTTRASGVVAINIGWRLFDGQVRVATYVGSDGVAGELRLPDRLTTGQKKVADLESIRDGKFNRSRQQLAEWLAACDTKPPWLVAVAATLSHWRSAGRLVALAKRWGKERFDGDAHGYEPLEAWRYNDHHLWSWQEHQRKGEERWRREMFRTFSAELAERYETLTIDGMNLTEVLKGPSVELSEKADGKVAARVARYASPGDLREKIIEAFVSRRGTVAKALSVDMTHTHHACGHKNDFDAALMVNSLCERCGAVFDQDENAARNYLKWWEEIGASEAEAARIAKNATNSPPKETRWARVARMKKERVEREVNRSQGAA